MNKVIMLFSGLPVFTPSHLLCTKKHETCLENMRTVKKHNQKLTCSQTKSQKNTHTAKNTPATWRPLNFSRGRWAKRILNIFNNFWELDLEIYNFKKSILGNNICYNWFEFSPWCVLKNPIFKQKYKKLFRTFFLHFSFRTNSL